MRRCVRASPPHHRRDRIDDAARRAREGSGPSSVGHRGHAAELTPAPLRPGHDGRRDPVEVALESARLRDLDALLTTVLTPRERDVLRRRFGLDGGEEETLERIAASFGLTRERVRQIQDKALGLLRQNVATYPLREYLVTNTRLDAVQPAADWVAENVPKGKRAPSERPRTDASTTTTHSPAKGDPRGQRTA